MAPIEWDAKLARPVVDGRVFDPSTFSWVAAPEGAGGGMVSAAEALRRLAAAGPIRRVPVGVIGPREAEPHQAHTAEELGRALALHGLQLLCGGKSGVMEAACRGHAEAGGLPIGILPDEEWQGANPFVAIPIATGIGPARNAIIARACIALVAVGGGVGTLSEMALGLQFGRLVLSMAGAPKVEGVPIVATVEEIIERVAERILTPV